MGQCYNSVVVNAAVENVWNCVKNFHDMSWAPNVITQLESMSRIPLKQERLSG